MAFLTFKLMSMKKIVLILLMALTAASTVLGQQDKRLKGVEKQMNEILKVTKAPGFTVAVVQGKKIIYAGGFGYKDYENKVPADPNTLYAVGSVTKAFTSALLGQLQEEGKLSLEDSPLKYTPDLKFFNSDMNNNIIIKDLMSHRTGLPRHDYSWYLFPGQDKDSLLKRIVFQEPFAGVRKQWRYNNFMFLAQGVIAEKVTGKSWEDNIRERFFKPLGMVRSNVSIDELKKSDNAAIGYKLAKDSSIAKLDYYHIAGMSPAGSINSSVNEMSNWLITWINDGKFKDQQVIPKNYLREAISSQMVISAGFPDKEFPDMHLANYGYGWSISSYKGHYRVDHGGNIDGFSASAAIFPSDSIGIVVLTNQDGSGVPFLVRNTIAERMLKLDRADWAKVFATRMAKAKQEEKDAEAMFVSNRIKNTSPSHDLQAYTGRYSSPGYGEFKISLAGDSLFANFKLMKFYLRHIHHDIFQPLEVEKTGIDTADRGNLRFNFGTSDAGEIDVVRVKFEEAVDPIAFKHSPENFAVDKLSLAKYAGDFDLAGMPIKLYIKNESSLFMFVEGQPEYELYATGKHTFNVKKLDGYKLEFIESNDKSIAEVVLIQPNGTYRAKRR